MFDSLLTGLLAGLLGPADVLIFIPCLWLPPPLETSFWDGCGTFQNSHYLGSEAGAVLVYRLYGHHRRHQRHGGCSGGEGDKMAISGAVPVVGDALNATETVLAGAAAVRSTAGSPGTAGDFSHYRCAFLKLGFQYLLLKLTAALCGVVGAKTTALTESFAQAMGLLLATTGTCCLIQLISTVCFMKGVI